MTQNPSSSRLSPNLIRNRPDQRQLLLLLLLIQRIPALMRTKPTLRAHTNPLERLLRSLTTALSHPLRRADHPLLHVLLVLQLRELSADDADDDVLVLGEVLEGLKTAGALGVVFEVEGVDVEGLEELLGNDVVGALGEVAATDCP